MEGVGFSYEGERNMREFKLGRGFSNEPTFGDVTGYLSPGVNVVDNPVVQYFTTNGGGEIITRTVSMMLIPFPGTFLDFINENTNNRVFIHSVTSLRDGTIYSIRNGNFDNIPPERGVFIRAAIIYL